jgi:hypothetical protein
MDRSARGSVWFLIPTVDLFLPVPMFRESDNSPATGQNIFATRQLGSGSSSPMYFGQGVWPAIYHGEVAPPYFPTPGGE